ncbi:undecaprenyl/decaprenyl-phosphate alpha-N-acetylglucosaminyl 1-phosphate transferase [Candidatus Collierbacteria bacterium]|nr:undecaprenyl/decaprenyl-phosphate alpha-N-acetylglucosaminyl 1-phosphate transferase [Candidatus Collierbacteria bacterium]
MILASPLWLIFLSVAAASFLATLIVIKTYRKIGAVDIPDPQKPMTTHNYPVPRGGGLAVFVGILFGIWLFLPIDKHLSGIIVGAAIAAGVGFLDDLFNLNPYLRLLLLLMIAAAVIASGIGIPFINLPFLGIVNLDQPKLTFFMFGESRSLWLLADAFAVIWIIGLMNFVNWSKGLDGQLPGIVVIASLVVGTLSLKFSADISQWPVIILAMITAGAYFGFLPWNFYPQKIMPGYGGGILGGFLLAVMSILSNTKVGTLLVVLGVPIIDAIFIIIRRIAGRKSPVWGDRGHLHHRLLDDFNMSKRSIAITYWAVTAVLGLIALRLNSRQKFYTMLAVSLIIGGILLWIKYFGRLSRQPGRKDG